MFFLIVFLMACDSNNQEESNLTGVVLNKTSCSGGVEPVFIIKLSENDSIITSTLPKEFQVTNLKIKFKTRAPSANIFCTTDKIYPEGFDVYDVMLFSD